MKRIRMDVVIALAGICLLVLILWTARRKASSLPKRLADAPVWVQQLGASMKKAPDRYGANIYANFYKGNIVFYASEPPYDRGSRLYDWQGVVICSPDGGYAGNGDGKCPDYSAKGQIPLQ